MKIAGNDKAYHSYTVRPDPDQRSDNEIYNAGLIVEPLQEVCLPPLTRAIITVKNIENLPENIFGYINQDTAWQEDCVYVENFFIERSEPDIIKITLANKSMTYTFKLTAKLMYGGLIIRRFRRMDDRYFKQFIENFRSEILEKGNNF